MVYVFVTKIVDDGLYFLVAFLPFYQLIKVEVLRFSYAIALGSFSSVPLISRRRPFCSGASAR